MLQTYMGHGYEVLDTQASCDSAHIASGGMDKSVFYWDVSTGQIVRKFRGHVGNDNFYLTLYHRFHENYQLKLIIIIIKNS